MENLTVTYIHVTGIREASRQMASPSALFSMTAPQMYTIGDLARELDISTRTIRYYEERGLLRPQRTANTQQRLYTPGDRVRLKLLLRARGLGFRLEDIRELFEIYDATHDERLQGQRLRQMIVERLRQIESQLTDLTDLRDELRDALAAVDRQIQPK